MNAPPAPTTPPHGSRLAAFPDPWARILAIAIVFALGATASLPATAQAQVSADLDGFVLDPNGDGIAGATVTLRREVAGGLWALHETTTGEDGSFSLSDMGTGEWNVTARLDGYITLQTQIELTGGDNAHNLTIQSLFSRFYHGTVLTAESETPIEGARVTVSGYDSQSDGKRETTTAADGTFSIQLFPQGNQIRVSKSGYHDGNDWVHSPAADITRTFYLSERAPQSVTVTGTVVDAATGEPVEALIQMWPDWSQQDCCVAYDSGGDGAGGGSEDSIAIAPYPYPDWNNNHNSTPTDTGGAFAFNAYPGAVVLSANREGYLVNEVRLTLEEDGTHTAEFRLEKLPDRSVTIAGIVTDRSDGEPVVGAQISVQVPGGGDNAWTQTDKDGAFEVTVRPGYTLVEVYHDGRYYVLEEAVAVDAETQEGQDNDSLTTPAPPPDKQEGTPRDYYPFSTVFTTAAGDAKRLNVALTAKPEPTTTVVGYVIDTATETGIAHARVYIQNHATGDWGEAITDENGSYKFVAHGGYHTVRAWHDGYHSYAANAIVPSSGATRVDLSLTPGTYAHDGWWQPGQGEYGYAYGDGFIGGYADSDATYAEGSDGAGGMPAPVTGSGSSSGRAGGSGADEIASSGRNAISGSPGGLPAYDPDDARSTFGAGDSADSPSVTMPLLITLAAVGAILMGRLRRR